MGIQMLKINALFVPDVEGKVDDGVDEGGLAGAGHADDEDRLLQREGPLGSLPPEHFRDPRRRVPHLQDPRDLIEGCLCSLLSAKRSRCCMIKMELVTHMSQIHFLPIISTLPDRSRPCRSCTCS